MSYNELKIHGSAGFPIELYHLDKSEPKYEMAHHWHKNIELIKVLKGKLRVFLDGREYLLSEGDLAFVNSETIHSAIPEEECVYRCVVYDPEFFSPSQDGCAEFAESISHKECLVKEFHKSSSLTAKRAGMLFSAMENVGDGCSRFYVLSCIYALYDALITEKCVDTSHNIQFEQSDRNIVKLKKVLSYIRTCFGEQITLSDMARVCDMSPKYFCSFFKKMTKKSPVEYLNSYRIEKACRMLLKTDLSVTEVAFSCGFGDLSYFIKTFKKHTGQSPGKYCK